MAKHFTHIWAVEELYSEKVSGEHTYVYTPLPNVLCCIDNNECPVKFTRSALPFSIIVVMRLP